MVKNFLRFRGGLGYWVEREFLEFGAGKEIGCSSIFLGLGWVGALGGNFSFRVSQWHNKT